MRYLWAILAALVLCGCGSGLNPIGPITQIGMYWIEGEAHKYYNTDQKKLHAALMTALEKLEFPIKEQWEKDSTMYVTCGDKGSDRFKIKVTAVRHNITRLSIRVNTFGDKPYAELIYRNVDKVPNIEQFTSVKAINTEMKRERR